MNEAVSHLHESTVLYIDMRASQIGFGGEEGIRSHLENCASYLCGIQGTCLMVEWLNTLSTLGTALRNLWVMFCQGKHPGADLGLSL